MHALRKVFFNPKRAELKDEAAEGGAQDSA